MKEDIYNYYDEKEERNLRLNDKYNKNQIKINSTTMRISVLEDRTKSLEKMLRLFEERLNLKEEEKLAEIKNIESSINIVNKLNKKIKNLEKQIKEITTQNQIKEEQNAKKIAELKARVDFLEGKPPKNPTIINTNEDLNVKDISLNEKSSNILMCDYNEILKNNNLQIDEYIQEKIYNSNIENENKINELLNLIQDINKIVEENENKINSLNLNFNKFQNDNVNIIQMISIQEEKIKNVDFMFEEIKKLKIKFNELASNLDDKNEEDKFTKEFLNSVRIK